METILIVEDNNRVGSTLMKYLSKVGYRVIWRTSGLEAHQFITENSLIIDLVLLDIKVPSMNGLDICRQVRQAKIQVPILMLTSIGDVDTIINCLDIGADDYLTKPFALPEVLARVRALLRRPSYFEARILTVADIKINPDTREVIARGVRLDLRRKEFDVLYYMARNRSQMLSREQILMNVWNMATNPYPNNVDVHIKHIRAKLEEVSPKYKHFIQTIYGFGYKLNG